MNVVSHRRSFMTSKLRQNQCGLKVFTRNRLRKKIKAMMVYNEALHSVLNSLF